MSSKLHSNQSVTSDEVFARIWVLDRYDLKITPEIWGNKKLKKALLKNIDVAMKQVTERRNG